MKNLLLSLLFASIAFAEDLPNFISTPRGFTYQNVKVLSSTRDSITFSYDGGTTTLAIADLSQAWRDHFKMVEPAAPAALPAPLAKSKTYAAAEIKTHEADLKGQVVPVRLAYDSGTSLEPQDDGSFLMFVMSKEGSDFVVFPAQGAAYMKTVLGAKAGMLNAYGLVRPGQPTLIVGREFDPKSKSYVW
jgi:hypothetical protein